MLPRKLLLLVLQAAFLASAAFGAPSHIMLVVSKGLPGATIYDADTQQAICSAKMGVSPHEAAFSNDGRFAYVPVYGSSSVGLPGTDEHTLHFIRTSDCKEVGVLDTGDNRRPHGIAVGSSGHIYLTTETTESIQVIDPITRTILESLPTGSKTSHILALAQDEKTIYTSNVMSKTVSVIDVPKREVEKSISTGCDNQRMTISPNDHWFVTSLVPDHKIAFYRTADDQLDFTIPLDGSPFVAKFSEDGKYLYDAGNVDGHIRVWKIDVAQRKVLAETNEEIGQGVGTLTVNPFNGMVYISAAQNNQISEIDPETWKVTKRLPTEKTPDAILFATVK